MKIFIKKNLISTFILLTASWTYANENFPNINKINIERALAAPKSELEYKTALEVKQMLATATPSKDAINAARSICYSSLVGNNNRAIIMIPLPNNLSDLDAVCQVAIHSGWNAGGIAKPDHFIQNCSTLDNINFGGGYTSYATEAQFEGNRNLYTNCGPTNAMICCSEQYPN